MIVRTLKRIKRLILLVRLTKPVLVASYCLSRLQYYRRISPEFRISGTVNLDFNACYQRESNSVKFQAGYQRFLDDLLTNVESGRGYSYLKFGDGDYYFLKGMQVGSAKAGMRATSRIHSPSELLEYRQHANRNNFFHCEIYPENRERFQEIFPNVEQLSPAEYIYASLASRDLFSKIRMPFGFIGAHEKLVLIEHLNEYAAYKAYLGYPHFSDFIHIPQRFAIDDPSVLLSHIKTQMQYATARIFLVGVGHSKSWLLSQLRDSFNVVFLDVGSGIDALAGIIDARRPYFGNWVNFRSPQQDLYSNLDLLQYKYARQKTLS